MLYNSSPLWQIPKLKIYNEMSHIDYLIDVENIYRWFNEIMYDIDETVIRRQRAHFYIDVRRIIYENNFFDLYISCDEYLIKYFPRFKRYKDISDILKILRNNLNKDIKQELYLTFLKIYYKRFCTENNNASTSINNYLNYFIKLIDENYIERCKRLFDIYVERTRPEHLKRRQHITLSNMDSLYRQKLEREELIMFFEDDIKVLNNK